MVAVDCVTAGIGHNRPCLLCGSSEHLGLIERVAADLWESRRTGHLDDRPWAEAGEYWQRIFRGFAESAIESIRGHQAAEG